jgi:ABC-type dipeptide/oligopeptide/nickel transport system permease component
LVAAFVFASVRGAGGSFSSLHAEPILLPIMMRFPSTLELLIGSSVLAGGAVFAIVALSRRLPVRLRNVPEYVALPLRSIPLVWLTAVGALLVAHFGGQSEAFGAVGLPYFDVRDRVAHLFVPSVCLALFEVPFLINARSLGDLLHSLANGFPEILGAIAVTETLFAWPGDGRLFFEALVLRNLGLAVALLLLAAFAILLMRVAVSDAQA